MIILNGCCNNPRVRFHEIVKGYSKIRSLGDQVGGICALRLRENTGRAQKKKKRQRKNEKGEN